MKLPKLCVNDYQKIILNCGKKKIAAGKPKPKPQKFDVFDDDELDSKYYFKINWTKIAIPKISGFFCNNTYQNATYLE